MIQNLKKNWLVVWKITWAIWQIFTRTLESWDSKLGLLWGTVIPSRKYMSLKFSGELCVMIMIQKLKWNWLVSSKLTWGVWQILIQALESLKNLHFNWLPLTKVYNIWAKKVQRSYVWWHWILMQNLKENRFVLSKMTGIWEIFTRALESLEIGTSMGFFYPKLENVWA